MGWCDISYYCCSQIGWWQWQQWCDIPYYCCCSQSALLGNEAVHTSLHLPHFPPLQCSGAVFCFALYCYIRSSKPPQCTVRTVLHLTLYFNTLEYTAHRAHLTACSVTLATQQRALNTLQAVQCTNMRDNGSESTRRLQLYHSTFKEAPPWWYYANALYMFIILIER